MAAHHSQLFPSLTPTRASLLSEGKRTVRFKKRSRSSDENSDLSRSGGFSSKRARSGSTTTPYTAGSMPAPRGRPTTAQKHQDMLHGMLATVSQADHMFVPVPRVSPLHLELDETEVPDAERLPAEMEARLAALPPTSWTAWHLDDRELHELAALLCVTPAERFSLNHLRFWGAHLLPHETQLVNVPFKKHVRAASAAPNFFAKTGATMCQQLGCTRVFKLLDEEALAPILTRILKDVISDRALIRNSWCAFLRWARPGGGAELRWRVNVAMRMLSRPVWYDVLVKPAGFKSLEGSDNLIPHYNRVLVPIVNRFVQLTGSTKKLWAILKSASEHLSGTLAAPHTLLVGFVLASVDNYKLCERRQNVKKNAIALNTSTNGALLPLPPALPPNATFVTATNVIVKGQGNDPWTAHAALECESERLAARQAQAEARECSEDGARDAPSPPREQELQWLRANWSTSMPGAEAHPAALFSAVWRLYALEFPEAGSPASLVALMRDEGIVSSSFQSTDLVPLALKCPKKAVPDMLNRLLTHQGALVEHRIAAAVGAATPPASTDAPSAASAPATPAPKREPEKATETEDAPGRGETEKEEEEEASEFSSLSSLDSADFSD